MGSATPDGRSETLRDAPGPYVRGLGCGGYARRSPVPALGFGGTKRCDSTPHNQDKWGA
jgi:hypothetical protein